MQLKTSFKLRGSLSKEVSLTILVTGFILIIAVWEAIVRIGGISPAILPSPLSVITCFPSLHYDDALVRNLLYSGKINFYGYVEASFIAIPLGFVIGLLPLFREMCRKYIDALRFLPLTAITGLFIAWFGIGTEMKVHFLAFGIIVYLLPVVVQRISEVEEVYCDTVYTLGANSWQTIWSVFVPAVAAKISDDLRVIAAMSWTYIIVAELINRSDGGIGAMAFTAARQSRMDKVFAILLVIIFVGLLQDRIAIWIDKFLFPAKQERYD